MKRIFCLFVGFVFLCGCRQALSVRAVTENISYDAEIVQNGEAYTVYTQVAENGEVVFTVSKPERIEGFSARFTGEGISLSYRGLTVSADTPAESVFHPLYEINSFLLEGNYVVKSDRDGFFVSGTVDSGDFILYLSEAGLPLSARFDNTGYTVRYCSVTLSK